MRSTSHLSDADRDLRHGGTGHPSLPARPKADEVRQLCHARIALIRRIRPWPVSGCSIWESAVCGSWRLRIARCRKPARHLRASGFVHNHVHGCQADDEAEREEGQEAQEFDRDGSPGSQPDGSLPEVRRQGAATARTRPGAQSSGNRAIGSLSRLEHEVCRNRISMLRSRPLHKKLLEPSAGCASDRREQARKWSLMTGALTFGRTAPPLESAASGVQFGLRAQEGGRRRRVRPIGRFRGRCSGRVGGRPGEAGP